MKMFTRWTLTTAALLVAAASTTHAQGSLIKSADATATVVLQPYLTLQKTSDMSFGTHFGSDGIVYSETEARWDGTTDPGNTIRADFTSLPMQLDRVGGGGSVPVAYGNMSAVLVGGGATPIVYNPASGSGAYTVGATSDFNVRLGLAASAANGVSVNLNGRPAGTYRGTITLTITVL